MSALLRDDPLKPAMPLTNGTINETLRQFVPLYDDGLLQLVDCRESSTLIDHLLKGTPSSAIDWIQVRAVWGQYVRLDKRDVLTPQVRRCVPGSVTINTLFPVVNFLTWCCYRSRLVFKCCFKTLDISQGSVATHLKCGGIFSDSRPIIAIFFLILIVK